MKAFSNGDVHVPVDKGIQRQLSGMVPSELGLESVRLVIPSLLQSTMPPLTPLLLPLLLLPLLLPFVIIIPYACI